MLYLQTERFLYKQVSEKAKKQLAVLATFMSITKKNRGVRTHTLYLVFRDLQRQNKGLSRLIQ